MTSSGGRQRDFPRKLGLGIVIAGVALSYHTRFISLLVATALDVLLYYVLPEVTVCYRCGAVFRKVPLNPEHSKYNLGIQEKYDAEWRRTEHDSGRANDA